MIQEKYRTNIPVAIFLWKRPESTKQILGKILDYKPKKLLVVIKIAGLTENLSDKIERIRSGILLSFISCKKISTYLNFPTQTFMTK